MKNAVYQDHKVRLDDLEVKFRMLRDAQADSKIKVQTIEDSLPKMIRELIDFYLE